MNDKNINEINKITDLISSLIHEYLYKKDYLKTLDIFQQELSEKIKSGQFYSLLNNNKVSYDSSSLINYFESGNKKKFMEHWCKIIPNNLKLTVPTLFKLDFNIEIYFSIYPILKPNANINDIRTLKSLKQNMEEFKIYLEQNNTEQFKTPEFLSYYALPYVADPRNNPIYAHLFTPEWTKCLKEQIQKCLDYYSPKNFNKLPILYDLTRGKKVITVNNNISNNLKDNNNNKKDENTIKELINDNKILNEENNMLKIKDDENKKIYIDAQKTWCSLALDIISYSFDLMDLYNKITNNQKNNTIDEINNKLLKYQNFLIKNFEELEKNNKNINEVDNMLNSKEFKIINNDTNIEDNPISKDIPNIKDNKSNNFDYISNIANSNKKDNISNMDINSNILNNSIKFNNLISSSDKKNRIINQKINENYSNKKNEKNLITNNYSNNLINMKKLIQALNKEIYIDDNKIAHILQEIRFRIYNKENPDIRKLTLFEIFYYDLLGTLSNSSIIFKQLLSNKILNLEVMKLVNGLANFNAGKNYLLSKNNLIEDIVKCMIAEKNDTELRQNCLGAIQKFTLRNEPQNKLIELNVIHYLVDIFTNQSDSLSDYSIEYGLALLMNLSLRKEGKEKFEAVGEKIIKIILNFLNCDNIQILTCINGMLYSLLKKKKFRELARNMGVEEKLKELEKFNNKQINKQIKYILDELNNYSSDKTDYNGDIKEESFAEEDINTKDDLNNIYNEYPEKKIYDEKYIEEHYKILSDFIITNNKLELIEKTKIIYFMNENINMTKGLLATINNISNDSSFRNEENNNIRIEEREEEIINTNMNEEENEDNNNYEEQRYECHVINENNNDFDDIYGRQDDGFAFKTKDKLKRTPPRQNKYEGQRYKYNVINENNNDFDDIYGRQDDGFAFKTKDKLKRTPPKQNKF